MFITRIFCVLLPLVVPAISAAQRGCDRSRSRLVRKVVYEKVMPAFSAINTELSDECVFSPMRDRYRTHETHKSIENGNQWMCHFCGKHFVSEYFLDLHFDNRHTDQIEEDNALCLADACEVFRCDILGRRVTPDYWDIALCLDDDMKSLHRKCAVCCENDDPNITLPSVQTMSTVPAANLALDVGRLFQLSCSSDMSMVKSCVPSGLTENETRHLTEVSMDVLCSYLTCSKYWEIPFDTEMSEGMTGIYIIVTVMITFSITIYYCIFYTYFYTDTFADSIAYDPTPRSKQPIKPYQADVRQRSRASHSPHPD